MKKVFAIACLLVVLVSAMAVAGPQTPWRFSVKADNGSGSLFMAASTIGVATNGKDGFGLDGTASDLNDGAPSWTAGAGSRGLLGVFGGNAWFKDVKSTRSPFDPYYAPGMPSLNGAVTGVTPNYDKYQKIWDLRAFAMPLANSPAGVIRLQFFTVSAATFPVSSVTNRDGVPVTAAAGYLHYTLRMVNNKGVEGAPANYDPLQTPAWNIANGRAWDIPIPTVHSTTVPYFTLTLPALYLSSANSATAMSEGYQLQFIQSVPEPGTVAAALALLAPAGFMFRRRRS